MLQHLRWLFCVALGIVVVTLSAPADAGQVGSRSVNNATGQSFTILAFSDGARRDKYAVMDPVENRPYWYASNGSANGGRGESGRHTSSQEWCRVRYLYGDDVRIPECWGSFMYSSHVITGIDGLHYELWFSPSSLSYFKIRAQETNTWYAHDGSANDGRVQTTKEDWCRVIIFHGNGIVQVPNECADILKKIAAVTAGIASPAEATQEMKEAAKILGFYQNTAIETAGNAVDIAKGQFSPGGVGVGVAVGYGTEAVKDALGLRAQNANAGQITAEILTTTAVNSSVTTMIMTVAGSSFNPVAFGVGVLVSGAAAGGQALYTASKDAGIKLYDGYGNHPRYNRDLDGLTSVRIQPRNLPGVNWARCASENETCNLTGVRNVRYGGGGVFVTRNGQSGAVQCSNAVFGDPIAGVRKFCEYEVTWNRCAWEGETCNVSGVRTVRYGANGAYRERTQVSSAVQCTNAAFSGDPAVGIRKQCDVAD